MTVSSPGSERYCQLIVAFYTIFPRQVCPTLPFFYDCRRKLRKADKGFAIRKQHSGGAMIMFEFLIGLEIAAIAAMLGVAFAPAAVWALFNCKPPHWTRAARSPSPVRARKEDAEDPLALENFVGRGAMKGQLPFGEMG